MSSFGAHLLRCAPAVAGVILAACFAVDVQTAHGASSRGKVFQGTSRSESIRGTDHADLIRGAGGKDTIAGMNGDDQISGGSGDDQISGGSGSDQISGGPGRDQVSGGRGNDKIDLRDGRLDRVTCGAGRDRVQLDAVDRLGSNASCEIVSRPAPPPVKTPTTGAPDPGGAVDHLSTDGGARASSPQGDPSSSAPPPTSPATRCPASAPTRRVSDFGSSGAGAQDDQPAFAAALAALPQEGPGVVEIPTGRYRMTRPLLIDRDDTCIEAASGGVATLLLDVPAGSSYSNSSVLFVNRGPTSGTTPVHRVTIHGLSVRVRHVTTSGAFSMGVVQLNNCVDCDVTDVQLAWEDEAASPDEKPANLDGIVMGLGSSGTIARVRVDGMPKTGIYLTQGAHDVLVDTCEVLHTGATPSSGQIWGTGLDILGTDQVVIKDCQSHDNAGQGMVLAVSGTAADAAPATHTTVDGGAYYRNGQGDGYYSGRRPGPQLPKAPGIVVGSSAAGFDIAPAHVLLTGATLTGNSGNGIYVTAAHEIVMDNLKVQANGYDGIFVGNSGVPRVVGLTRDITIRNSLVYGNAQDPAAGVYPPSVEIRAADSVTVEATALLPPYGGTQRGPALALYPSSPGLATGSAASDVTLDDIEVGLGYVVYPGSGTVLSGAVSSGHFSLRGQGDPNTYRSYYYGTPTGAPAPPGSAYLDTKTGRTYVKRSGPLVGSGWDPG